MEEECSGFLVDIESSDEDSDGGGLVTATRLLRRSRGEILMRIPLIKVPGLFSPLSSGVHDVKIRFQYLSAINVVVARATGGGDRVDCSWLLTNIFPYDDGMSLTDELSITLSTMEDNGEDEGMEGAIVNSKAGKSQLECISEDLADGPSRTYHWCQNIEGLKFLPPQISAERTGTTPPGNRRIGESTKAAVRCILCWVCAHVSLNSILRDLERRPSQILPVHPTYSEREESECREQGYSRRPLSTRLDSWTENSPPHSEWRECRIIQDRSWQQ